MASKLNEGARPESVDAPEREGDVAMPALYLGAVLGGAEDAGPKDVVEGHGQLGRGVHGSF